MTTMVCPHCHETTLAARFCQQCGKPLPPPAGGNAGDIVAVGSPVLVGNTFVNTDPGAVMAAKCPICGRRNNPENTFECHRCGRDHLCVDHQDRLTYWCATCVEEERRLKAEEEAKREAEDLQIAAVWSKLTAVHRVNPDRAIMSLTLGLDMEFVRVPAGEFLYGDAKERHRTEQYWIGRAPVTTAHFLAFIKANGYKADKYYSSKVARQQLNHPAKEVSWADAQAWCQWASGLAKFEIRLPSEIEWEKAARGTDGREYPWGNMEPTHQHANFPEFIAWLSARGEDRWKFTTSIGQFSPKGDSPYGLVDAVGNVSERCEGWYDSEKMHRVLRGSSFEHEALRARCAVRNADIPIFHLGYVGFRVVASLPSLG